MKRILALLAITGAMTATSVSTAGAAVLSNETVSYAYSGFVPCANDGMGELLTGTIDVHNLATATVNGNTDNSQFMSQSTGSLVGTSTGDTYRLAAVTHGTYNAGLENGKYILSYVNRYHLIGPGAGNNLVVRETAHLTIDGDDVVASHDDFSIECE